MKRLNGIEGDKSNLIFDMIDIDFKFKRWRGFKKEMVFNTKKKVF